MNTKPTSEDEVLRGFEIVKRFGPVMVECGMRYRPTILGAKQAAADCKWLKWRHPEQGYELRALVSVPRNEFSEEEPLVLDADVEDAPAPTEAL